MLKEFTEKHLRRLRRLALALIVAGIQYKLRAGDIQLYSKWDESLLKEDFNNVHIRARSMQSAWAEISREYMLRANWYIETELNSDSKAFSYDKATATGKELIDAFLATYPAYVYSEDADTGVIWFHPRGVEYQSILGQKIRISRPIHQAPALDGVILPLCKLLSAELYTSSEGSDFGSHQAFNFSVDLPAGVYTAREIVNHCCIWNPNKAFNFLPESSTSGAFLVQLHDMYNFNPLVPPRAASVRYWEIEIGKPTGGVPSASEIGAAMGDPDPQRRWASRSYFEASRINYNITDVIQKAGSPEASVWAALGVEAVLFKGINDPQFLLADAGDAFTTNLMQIKDPSVALVASLELAREKEDISYLDRIVSEHKFSEAEISGIKPDIYRLAHESTFVLDKLKAINLDAPEFSLESLKALENSNLLTLVPAGSR